MWRSFRAKELKPGPTPTVSGGGTEPGGSPCGCRPGSGISLHLQMQVVARRVRQILLHSEIPFRRLNRRVAERELDLIQLGAAFESQFGEGAPEVVGRDRLRIPRHRT